MRSETLLWQPKVAGGWSETARSYYSAGCRRWRVTVNGHLRLFAERSMSTFERLYLSDNGHS